MCHSEESVGEAGRSRVNGPLRSPLPLATFQASLFAHWIQLVWGSLGYSQYLLLQASDPWHFDRAGSSVILVQGSISQLSGTGWREKGRGCGWIAHSELLPLWTADPGIEQQTGIQFLRKGL